MAIPLNQFIFYFVLVLWCFFHSALISNTFISYAKIKLGNYFRYYRILYNLFSLLTFILLVLYSHKIESNPIFYWNGYWIIARGTILFLSFYLFIAGAKNYDTKQFIGLRQIKSSLNYKSLTGNANLNISGIQSIIRHPWYMATILLVWSRNLSVNSLIENMILTIYVIIGTYLEEKKIIREFGEEYRIYQKQVSMLVPVKWIKSWFSND